MAIFMNDPWWIVLIKVVGVVVLLLTWTIFNVWFERRLIAKMQQRIGPVMNPIKLGGLGQALGDGLKLLLKEDVTPGMVDRFLFTLAPVLAGICAFSAWSVIPLAGEVNMFGVTTRLQVTDTPVAVLLILAISSLAVYGFVLAGYSSNSPYSLLGALRSSAQMISYEISMGLSVVAVILFSGSMSTVEIVEHQALPLFGGNPIGLQQWYWLILLPSFVIYVISMVGETNRLPFDLPEGESELVAGHMTEYSAFRYAIFFLAEYINMATVSAVATTLFLGGYHAFWPFSLFIPDTGWWGLLWFVLKVQLLISMFVWLRASLPRFRYDQFMNLGWRYMIPISLAWVIVISLFRGLMNNGLLQGPLLWIIIGIIGLAFVALLFLGGEKEAEPEPEPAAFDAFAGGYPVPPRPGETLPELADLVAGETSPETADASASDVVTREDR